MTTSTLGYPSETWASYNISVRNVTRIRI